MRYAKLKASIKKNRPNTFMVVVVVVVEGGGEKTENYHREMDK